MRPNTDGLLELQIDDNPPFTPQEFGSVGVIYGEMEIGGTRIKEYDLRSTRSVLEYAFGGLYNKLFFRRGNWEEGTDGRPRFHVWEMLE